MPYLRPALSRRLTRRTCLNCGHSGAALQGQAGLATHICPECGADLYARPPRSYAEMEGLVEVSGARERWTHRRAVVPAVSRPIPVLHRSGDRPLAKIGLALAIVVVCAAAAFLLF